MHVSLCCAHITYCRGQACRRPSTYDFPTLAAIELRVLVNSKSGASSIISVSAAVRDPPRLLALILEMPLLAAVEALHVVPLLLARRRLHVTFAFTLALAPFAARLAARLATSFAIRLAFSLAILLLRGFVCHRMMLTLATSALAVVLAAFAVPLPLPLSLLGI